MLIWIYDYPLTSHISTSSFVSFFLLLIRPGFMEFFPSHSFDVFYFLPQDQFSCFRLELKIVHTLITILIINTDNLLSHFSTINNILVIFNLAIFCIFFKLSPGSPNGFCVLFLPLLHSSSIEEPAFNSFLSCALVTCTLLTGLKKFLMVTGGVNALIFPLFHDRIHIFYYCLERFRVVSMGCMTIGCPLV